LDADDALEPLATKRAAKPAVSPAAAEVPEMVAYPPLLLVVRMPVPGAATAALPVLL
jgi:hypothetical protein